MTDFTEIERRFRELLAQTGSLLTNSEQGEIRHFIDHGEYGLALETLVDILFEEAKTPPDDVVSGVAALADRMSTDPRPLLDRLRRSK
jgi:hypothetical protein